MSRISIKKRLPKYHKIYEQIFENPSVPLYQITKNTGISRSTVSRYVIEMYELSIIKGPMIFVKPAQNYHQYAAFLDFEHSLPTYKRFKGFPNVMHRSLSSGNWNILLICEKFMNFSMLKGFRHCIYQGTKGVTHLSRVTSLDWDNSMKKMWSALSPPREKSTLYEEIPFIPWKREEWALYYRFRHNIRAQVMPILKECRVRFERYQKWVTELPHVANIHAAFYPHGLDNYFILDFLFQSEYHKQLADILGMLPSTSIFFSTGEYLLARVSLLNKKEKDDLFSLIFQLEAEGYFTQCYQTMVVSTSGGG